MTWLCLNASCEEDATVDGPDGERLPCPGCDVPMERVSDNEENA